MNVVIHLAGDGRATGEADVDFATHEEAQQAMSKDRESMSKFFHIIFISSVRLVLSTFGCFFMTHLKSD